VFGILALFILSFTLVNVMLIWSPSDDGDESRTFVAKLNMNELMTDVNDNTGKFASFNVGEWVKIEDEIVMIQTEEEYLGPGQNSYTETSDGRYDSVLFIWVKSMGDARFSFNFSISAKKASQLNIFEVGQTLELELQITNKFVKGNVADHRELVYDPENFEIN
jgi:hypothetical protein